MLQSRCVGIMVAFCVGVGLTLAAQVLTEEVDRAEEAWVQARMTGNRTAYADLLADDFSWTYVTGRTIDKQQTLENLRAAPDPTTSKDIRVYQDAAVVVGTAELTFGGRPLTERFVRVWVKTGGAWRAILFQATEVPD